MVRPGLRRSEIDWENVDIHISREEMEREQEHEAAIQQAKQYLIKNFPKFCTINVTIQNQLYAKMKSG